MPAKRWVAALLLGIWMLHLLPVQALAASKANAVNDPGVEESSTALWRYVAYRRAHTAKAAQGTIVLSASDAVTEGDCRLDTTYTEEGATVLYTGDSSLVTWQFTVPEDAYYGIEVNYYTVAGNGGAVERAVLIDGALPFYEAGFVTFDRVYRDALTDGVFATDKNGNHVRPLQEEVFCHRVSRVEDSTGVEQEPLQFYLTKGTHTLSLRGQRDTLVLRSVTLYGYTALPTYAEMQAEYATKGYTAVDTQPLVIQAEQIYQKSDAALVPVADRSSPATYPNDPAKFLYNAIGGETWETLGQWITWQVNVEKSGLYQLELRYQQNILDGLYATREIAVDGEVPFEEWRDLRFYYGDGWRTEALGGDTPYNLYLEEGPHTITMKAVIGDLGLLISEVQEALTRMNAIYLDLLMIIGPTADIYRDYAFDKRIPAQLEELEELSKRFYQVSAQIRDITDRSSQHTALLDKIALQLHTMGTRHDKIAANFSSFKDNISALGTWLLELKTSPLEIDFLRLSPAGSSVEPVDASAWEKIVFSVKAFVFSFFTDYQLIGDEVNSDKAVRVWLSSGKDQATIIRQMISADFTPPKRVDVNLELVVGGALLLATLSGDGPDVAMFNGGGDAVSYGLRGAAHDLTGFADFAEVAARFDDSAIGQLTFGGKTYGLPETQSFPMLFYRTDILAQMGLNPPDNWADFYALIPQLQKNNMQVGFVSGLAGLAMFLYQDGGELYRNNGERLAIDEQVGLEAFDRLCRLYTQHGLQVEYNFINLFRSGEMPVAVTDYTAYNTLVVFAPEIKGLWEMAPIPGTMKEDGSVDRSAGSSVTCLMMMKDVKDPELAWEYMKWWTEADTQSTFSRNMEALLGASARYATANLEAFARLSWTTSEVKAIRKQWEELIVLPEVPGGYYTGRAIDFAFTRVYNTKDDAVDTLYDYIP
ncbi:MAG: extracellular solute-binding protein, partial [Clostridia bacterium]|nr:extracellular solute-binding protein [Clostridia bacterium]